MNNTIILLDIVGPAANTPRYDKKQVKNIPAKICRITIRLEDRKEAKVKRESPVALLMELLYKNSCEEYNSIADLFDKTCHFLNAEDEIEGDHFIKKLRFQIGDRVLINDPENKIYNIPGIVVSTTNEVVIAGHPIVVVKVGTRNLVLPSNVLHTFEPVFH